jgi:hypothetical protein
LGRQEIATWSPDPNDDGDQLSLPLRDDNLHHLKWPSPRHLPPS